jgi:hypothetical protein
LVVGQRLLVCQVEGFKLRWLVASGQAIEDNEGAFLPCMALLPWIAILKGQRLRGKMAEVEMPPNLMGWGMVVVVGGGRSSGGVTELCLPLFW